MSGRVRIRKETESDFGKVKEVLDLAFGQAGEGKLVEKLRDNPEFIPELSLVAEFKKEIIGYILFFPIRIKSDKNKSGSLALAPMAVLPLHQRSGVGTQLVEEGLARTRELGYGSVVVVGHPRFYPRFGFVPASRWKIKAPFDVPDEAFLALELRERGLDAAGGLVLYPPGFSEL
jgi:putative acetyltransferase